MPLVCVTRVWGANRALAEATSNIAARGIVDAPESLTLEARCVPCCALRALLGWDVRFLARLALRLGRSALELDVCDPALWLNVARATNEWTTAPKSAACVSALRPPPSCGANASSGNVRNVQRRSTPNSGKPRPGLAY